MVTSILPLFSTHARVLFYLGSTHFFVSCAFVKKYDKSLELLDFKLLVILYRIISCSSLVSFIEGRELLAKMCC